MRLLAQQEQDSTAFAFKEHILRRIASKFLGKEEVSKLMTKTSSEELEIIIAHSETPPWFRARRYVPPVMILSWNEHTQEAAHVISVQCDRSSLWRLLETSQSLINFYILSNVEFLSAFVESNTSYREVAPSSEFDREAWEQKHKLVFHSLWSVR